MHLFIYLFVYLLTTPGLVFWKMETKKVYSFENQLLNKSLKIIYPQMLSYQNLSNHVREAATLGTALCRQ